MSAVQEQGEILESPVSHIGARGRTFSGDPLTPGVNVDRVDVAAGLRLGRAFGYDDGESQMVLEYALMRHRRGEEDGAQRTALSGGIDLTSWYAVLAAALAAAEPAPVLEDDEFALSIPGVW